MKPIKPLSRLMAFLKGTADGLGIAPTRLLWVAAYVAVWTKANPDESAQMVAKVKGSAPPSVRAAIERGTRGPYDVGEGTLE